MPKGATKDGIERNSVGLGKAQWASTSGEGRPRRNGIATQEP